MAATSSTIRPTGPSPLCKKNNIYEFEVELCEVGIRHKEILVNEAAASSSSMGQSGPARPEDVQLVAARPDEARTAKSLTLPKAPTNVAEVKAHSVTHMPHRDWCAHCVRGRGRAARHFNESDAAELPRLSTDYLFPGQKEDKRPLTGISFYDNASMRMALTILPRKGVDHPYATAWLKKQLDMGGYTRALVKNDQEPTLKALRRLALSQEPKSATAFTLEESMAGDSQTQWWDWGSERSTGRPAQDTQVAAWRELWLQGAKRPPNHELARTVRGHPALHA